MIVTFAWVDQEHLRTDKTETNPAKDIAPLVGNLDLSSLGEGLERASMEDRAPSPTIPEPPSPSGSEATEEQGRARRNTMAARVELGGGISLEPTPILNLEQMRQMMAFSS